MQVAKGQIGVYRHRDGRVVMATCVRPRGAGQVDLESDHVPAHELQMVDVGTGVGEFEPNSHVMPDAPRPRLRARMVPRHIPVWHAVLLVPPIAAAVTVITNLLWNWLAR